MFIKILKNKKGAVMEAAILFMVAAFSFCFLLSGLTISSHYRAKAENIKMEQELLDEMVIDRIVDEYLVFLTTVDIPEADANAEDETGPNASFQTFQNYIQDKSEIFASLLSKGYGAVDTNDFNPKTGKAVFFLVVTKGETTVLSASFEKSASLPTKIVYINKNR